ncbi:MAG TPA: hypothetical protein VGG01_00445 [Xanthobacteraceae bacterium]
MASVALAGIVAASGALAAGPPMSVNWTDAGPDQDTCVKQASDAMRQNKFSANFEVIGNRTIYGERDDFTAAIRCIAEKGVAFVAVAGPNGKLTGTYAAAIRDAFAPANSPAKDSPVMNGPSSR